MMIFLCIVIAIAYRGKGGGFASWGITPVGKNNLAHGLGALLVSIALGILSQWYYIPAYFVLWLLFTKPSTAWCLDLCSGFSWPLLAKATARQLLIIPTAILFLYVTGGSPWALFGFLVLGSLYWIGGALSRHFKIDPVEWAEWATGISGIFFVGLM